MIVAVTPNPAIDSTWRVPGLAPGASYRVEAGRHRAGGKGINVARVLTSKRYPVTILATAGGTTGELLRNDLEHSGIAHTLLPVAAETRRSLALYDTTREDTTIVNEIGTDNSAEEWADFTELLSRGLDGCSVLVISGSTPGNRGGDLLVEWVERAVRAGIPTIIDTSGIALTDAARAGASILKPNRDELAASMGTSDVVAGANGLVRMGAGAVIVSLGADGLVLVGGNSESTPYALRGMSTPLLARLPQPLAGNPTGAGDAAVAAVAASLTDSSSAADLVLRATAWSAAAVLCPLAGEISPEHDALGSQVRITAVGPTTSLAPTETP